LDTERKKTKVWIRVVQIIVVAALLYFIWSMVSRNWGEIRGHEWHVNYLLLALSIITMVAALFVMSSALSIIFRLFSHEVPLLKAYKIAYLSQLGRYIPGKIWQVFGMIYLAGKEGMSRTEAISSFALGQLLSVPPSILVSTMIFVLPAPYSLQAFDLSSLAVVLGVVVIGSLVVIFKSQWLQVALSFVAARLGGKPIEFRLQKSIGVRILLVYFVAWTLYGLAFYLFLISVSDFPVGHVLQATALFCAAYVIGYWSVFAPGGIGVREAVLVLLLGPYLGTGVAAAVAALARIWSVVGEVIASLIAVKIK
jgi:uncharacterized membrane protein YbhN (UPF0104 family)